MITPIIDTKSNVPIYTQIYKYIRKEIESKRLTPGERLPSTRALAAHLEVSRNTIDMAYGQLIDEGYIESAPKRGYFVCNISANIMTIPEETHLTTIPQKRSKYDFDFSPYGVDLEKFPYSTWRKTMRDILYDDRNMSLFLSGDHQGDLEFRKAIADYLYQNRGLLCEPDQIVVGAGVDYLLMLLSQLLGKNTVYAIEDPSYMRAYRILTHLGCEVLPIPLDKRGMDIKKLTSSKANIAYITPSHQFPTGIVMPIRRRQEILAWANEKPNRFIIEDDYDSEFRYRGRPIPSLASIDKGQNVIYLGTFSKAIAPSIRISYMVLPTDLLEIYKHEYGFYSNSVPRIEQKQMTEFIRKGYFERHLNRMRILYRTKRDYILTALEPYDDRIKIYGENSGLHILVKFLDGREEQELIETAAQNGIHLYAPSDYTIQPKHIKHMKSTIILGYASISQKQLEPAMERLTRCFFKDMHTREKPDASENQKKQAMPVGLQKQATPTGQTKQTANADQKKQTTSASQQKQIVPASLKK